MGDLNGQMIVIRYVPLDQVVLWDKNPKLHDIGGIVHSIEKHGFRDAPIFDGTLGGLVAGNGRAVALNMMKEQGYEVPLGVATDEEGNWMMPVQFGIDAPSLDAAEAFGIDHNNLTMSGGDLTLFDMAKMWDEEGYKSMLERLAGVGDLLVTMDLQDIDIYLKGSIQFQEPRSISEDDTSDVMDDKSFKVMVGNRELYEDAVAYIRGILEENPEWEARMV